MFGALWARVVSSGVRVRLLTLVYPLLRVSCWFLQKHQKAEEMKNVIKGKRDLEVESPYNFFFRLLHPLVKALLQDIGCNNDGGVCLVKRATVRKHELDIVNELCLS